MLPVEIIPADGKYTHNHGARNNTVRGACASPEWSASMEPDALAPHLEAVGYRTIYMGKYLNNYGLDGTGAGGKEGVSYVPPGWTEWYGLKGNSRYFNYTISNNGVPEVHGDDFEKDYLTDVLTRRAEKFLDEALRGEHSESPFSCGLAHLLLTRASRLRPSMKIQQKEQKRRVLPLGTRCTVIGTLLCAHCLP